MNTIGERMTNRESLENEEEIFLKNENSGTDEDPKINYRGWKVMPFIIGKTTRRGFYVFIHIVFRPLDVECVISRK